MTKEEFLARCAVCYDMGLAREDVLRLMNRWVDVVMREGHSRLCDLRHVVGGEYHQDQWEAVHGFWYRLGGELGRLHRNSLKRFPAVDGERYTGLATLANDTDGYAIIQLAAILSHPCPRCATDPHAWHTRPGFCTHRQEKEVRKEEEGE